MLARRNLTLPSGDYVKIAQGLHEKGFTGLQQAHIDLTASLAEAVKDDNAFLTTVAEHQNLLSRPFSDSEVSFTVSKDDDTPYTETVDIGERVEEVRGLLSALEGELAQLWDEWEEAQQEIGEATKEILEGAKPSVSPDGHADGLFVGEMKDLEVAMEEKGAAFRKELETLATESVEGMKSNEKASYLGKLSFSLVVLTFGKELKHAIIDDIGVYVSHLMADDL